MASISPAVEDLVVSLHSIQAICLDGPYTLKSGLVSPFYIDLRLIVSHPPILRAVAQHMHALVAHRPYDVLCGVPYTALPIATLMSTEQGGRPMVMRRKEAKAYGLKKSIEGVFTIGQTCLVVEDLVTSGQSVFETIEPLEAVGLRVTDIVVLINREQGGRENIEKRGLQLHALVTITQVMDILHRRGKVTQETVDQVREFVRASQVLIQPDATAAPPAAAAAPALHHPRLSYADRIPHCRNSAARALLAIMDQKRTNLCLSADVTTKAQLLKLADEAGPYICMLKTHIDILDDFDASVVASLESLAKKHRFLLFEDRKFADIGSTVTKQYAGGVYRIAEWSHVVNAHVIAGPGTIAGLRAAVAKQLDAANADPRQASRGLLLIAEMSSEGALATGSYTDANVSMAEANAEFVFGFICQRALSKQPGMLHLSPGVQLPPADAPTASSTTGGTAVRTGTDTLGQQYHSPHDLIGRQGTDVIIVGRAIIAASDVPKESVRYQREGWQAYERSLAASQHTKA